MNLAIYNLFVSQAKEKNASFLLFFFVSDQYPVLAVIVKCDDLTAPANGEVDQPGNSVGTMASYSCKDGFELIGDKTRTCQENGEWSGMAPTCKCEHIY